MSTQVNTFNTTKTISVTPTLSLTQYAANDSIGGLLTFRVADFNGRFHSRHSDAGAADTAASVIERTLSHANSD